MADKPSARQHLPTGSIEENPWRDSDSDSGHSGMCTPPETPLSSHATPADPPSTSDALPALEQTETSNDAPPPSYEQSQQSYFGQTGPNDLRFHQLAVDDPAARAPEPVVLPAPETQEPARAVGDGPVTARVAESQMLSSGEKELLDCALWFTDDLPTAPPDHSESTRGAQNFSVKVAVPQLGGGTTLNRPNAFPISGATRSRTDASLGRHDSCCNHRSRRGGGGPRHSQDRHERDCPWKQRRNRSGIAVDQNISHATSSTRVSEATSGQESGVYSPDGSEPAPSTDNLARATPQTTGAARVASKPLRFPQVWSKSLDGPTLTQRNLGAFLDGLNAMAAVSAKGSASAQLDSPLVRTYLERSNESLFRPNGLSVKTADTDTLLQLLEVSTRDGAREALLRRIANPRGGRDAEESAAKDRVKTISPWVQPLSFLNTTRNGTESQRLWQSVDLLTRDFAAPPSTATSTSTRSMASLMTPPSTISAATTPVAPPATPASPPAAFGNQLELLVGGIGQQMEQFGRQIERNADMMGRNVERDAGAFGQRVERSAGGFGRWVEQRAQAFGASVQNRFASAPAVTPESIAVARAVAGGAPGSEKAAHAGFDFSSPGPSDPPTFELPAQASDHDASRGQSSPSNPPAPHGISMPSAPSQPSAPHAPHGRPRKSCAADSDSSSSSDSDSSDSDSDSEDDDYQAEKELQQAETSFHKRIAEIESESSRARDKGKRSDRTIQAERDKNIKKAEYQREKARSRYEKRQNRRAIVKMFRERRRDLMEEKRQVLREKRAEAGASSGPGRTKAEKKAWRKERRAVREEWKGKRRDLMAQKRAMKRGMSCSASSIGLAGDGATEVEDADGGSLMWIVIGTYA